MVRVLIIDDMDSFRTLLRYQLAEDGDIEIIGDAGTLDEALPLATAAPPDVVLTDLNFERDGPLERLDDLRAAAPGARVLLLSGMPGGDLAEAADRLRADGHVQKAADPAELRAAIRRLAA